MLLGSAAVNALAFSGSNYLFSMLRNNDLAEEKKRHDKAVEKLQAAQVAYNQRRAERLDFLNQELRREGLAEQSFRDASAAIREYNRVFNQHLVDEPPPTLSDFYAPSDDQKDRELLFIAGGLAVTGLLVYKMA